MFKVLVVEDEKAAQQRLIAMFHSINEYKVVGVCEEGEAVFRFLDDNSVDLICLDIGLPGINGVDLLRQFKNPDFYTIYITGESIHAPEAFDLGAVDFIRKPVEKDRLVEALGRFEAFRRGEGRIDFGSSLKDEYSLTDKEAEICTLIKGGYVKEEICQFLGIGPGTLKSHLNHIYDKILYKDTSRERKMGRVDSFARLLYFLYNL